MFISVIIPTCHRNDLLAKCLDCLAPGKQTLGMEHYEVIVSDDGSKSTAQELIKQNYPWARWVAGHKRGPAANRNHGAKAARGEWLVFTDDDCLPDAGFLSGYWSAAKMGGAPVLEGKTSPSGVRTRVDMECPANETGGYLWSCNMAVKKNLFFELDGLDENFPGPAMEDVDFRTRLNKAGRTIHFVPAALVLHPWRLKRGREFCKLSSRSMEYFIVKHPEMAKSISLKFLVINLARKFIKQIPPVVLACRGRGLWREVWLTIYTFYFLACIPKKKAMSAASKICVVNK